MASPAATSVSPTERLLQMLSVIIWMLVPVIGTSIVVFLLWFSNFTRTLAIGYILYIYLDNCMMKANPGSSWFRNLTLWKLLTAYFPIRLHKTVDLSPSRKYFFAYHPHGVIGMAAAFSFGTNALGVSEMFPGVEMHLATLDAGFVVPGFRELLVHGGAISVSKKSLNYALSHDQSVVVIIGGAAEAIDAIPGTNRLLLKNRFGFVKIALQNGADLVPVFGFGENDVWNQVENHEGTFVRRFQETFKKVTGVSPVLAYGRYGVVPFRRPVNVVVGEPLQCPKIEHPTNEEVEKYHALYVEALQKLYEKHKDEYLPTRKEDLVIVAVRLIKYEDSFAKMSQLPSEIAKPFQLLAVILWLLFPWTSLLFALWMIWYSTTTRTIFLPYLLYCFIDKSHLKGSKKSSVFRRSVFWKLLASYFPINIHKTVDLPPNKNYVFGCHPHGVIGGTHFLTFATDALGIDQLFPDIDVHTTTLASNFSIPLVKDLFLALGIISADKEALHHVLARGGSVMLVVGGAAEALLVKPGTNRLILRKRFGFIKIALQSGSSLVPVFSFGENNMWDQVHNEDGTLLRHVQEAVKRATGVSPIVFHGRMGLLPFRTEVNVVFGEPLHLPRIENPTQEEIQEYHGLYVEALQKLFDAHKDRFLPDRTEELVIY
ncbi:Diacylglycerol O-acyltransferase 2 [Rhizoclosmatium sp. JEL0117]|nr:Diacylglycerol O-acyltransferase 2 [Rhizoclosmatium sp. JEL0117]